MKSVRSGRRKRVPSLKDRMVRISNMIRKLSMDNLNGLNNNHKSLPVVEMYALQGAADNVISKSD